MSGGGELTRDEAEGKDGTVRARALSKVLPFSTPGALWREPDWEKRDRWEGEFSPWIWRKRRGEGREGGYIHLVDGSILK